MSDLNQTSQPYALPTALAAVMLAGIVAVGWQNPATRAMVAPSATAALQVARIGSARTMSLLAAVVAPVTTALRPAAWAPPVRVAALTSVAAPEPVPATMQATSMTAAAVSPAVERVAKTVSPRVVAPPTAPRDAVLAARPMSPRVATRDARFADAAIRANLMRVEAPTVPEPGAAPALPRTVPALRASPARTAPPVVVARLTPPALAFRPPALPIPPSLVRPPDGTHIRLAANQVDRRGLTTSQVRSSLVHGTARLDMAPARWIVVRRGQTLWQIARATYGSGSAYQAIYRANRGRIADARMIRPGEAIRLPALYRRTASNQTITVRPGQSLWRIAERVYGTGSAYNKIYRVNRSRLASPDMIRPGQVLALPSSARATG
ncbi:MAG: LysM peptidoglycan-binding domain-containing protein [Rhodospirillales bacterium]|nr:LysM peptidoglycan-binding domain-containing protein [Rhodospirillales bacterium]